MLRLIDDSCISATPYSAMATTVSAAAATAVAATTPVSPTTCTAVIVSPRNKTRPIARRVFFFVFTSSVSMRELGWGGG